MHCPQEGKSGSAVLCDVSWLVWLLATHPDPGLGEVGPHGDLLPGAHVGVPVPREQRLQLLQLLRGEVGPLAPLPLLLAVLVQAVVVAVADLAALARSLPGVCKVYRLKVTAGKHNLKVGDESKLFYAKLAVFVYE